MLLAIVALYSLYTLVSIYTSVMQVGFVKEARGKKAVLLSENDFIKAANYSVAKEKISIASAFFDYIIFIFWLGFGLKLLEQNLHFESEAITTVATVLSFLLIGSIFSMPFGYYEKFVLDEKFGFNKSTKAQWIKDTIISSITTILLGSLVVFGIYQIVSSFELWWLWSFCFIFIVIIFVNALFPTFRALFFDKLTPLDNEALNAEIAELMNKTGFASQGVFISDASKRDSRLNAYFGGLGKSKRVVLFDTLLEKLSTKELLAVLGHELGHFSHGDIYKNIAMIGVMLFAIFALFGNLPAALYTELGISQAPAFMMILIVIFMSPIGFFAMPLIGIVMRHNEYEADKMGSELGGTGGSMELANALVKLVNENRSFPLSHPLYIFFHYTHPPVLQRLKELGYNGENI